LRQHAILGKSKLFLLTINQSNIEGITNEQIGAVQSIVMAVSAGRVRAQFREARIKSKKNKKTKR